LPRITRIHTAVREKSFAVAQMLIENSRLDPNLMYNSGFNMLHREVMRRKAERVKFLRNQSRIDANKLSASGLNVVMMTKGCMERLKILLNCDRVDANALIGAGVTAFHKAVASRDHKMIRALLSHARVDPNVLTFRGRHALMLAKRPGVMHILVTNKRLNPNVRDALGYSVFQHKVLLNDLAMVTCLLNEGRADPHLLTSDGLRCVNLAKTDDMKRLLFGNERIISYVANRFQGLTLSANLRTKLIA
jgi:ankyrin repeat protein